MLIKLQYILAGINVRIIRKIIIFIQDDLWGGHHSGSLLDFHYSSPLMNQCNLIVVIFLMNKVGDSQFCLQLWLM